MIDARNRAVCIMAAVFKLGMNHRMMRFPLLQWIAIRAVLIRVHHGVFAHAIMQRLTKILLRDVADNPRGHVSTAFNQRDNWRLTAIARTAEAFAADKCFVHFHSPLQELAQSRWLLPLMK